MKDETLRACTDEELAEQIDFLKNELRSFRKEKGRRRKSARERDKYASDPVFRERKNKNNLARARNWYRKAHGIPLDAPVRVYTRKKRA